MSWHPLGRRHPSHWSVIRADSDPQNGTGNRPIRSAMPMLNHLNTMLRNHLASAKHTRACLAEVADVPYFCVCHHLPLDRSCSSGCCWRCCCCLLPLSAISCFLQLVACCAISALVRASPLARSESFLAFAFRTDTALLRQCSCRSRSPRLASRCWLAGRYEDDGDGISGALFQNGQSQPAAQIDPRTKLERAIARHDGMEPRLRREELDKRVDEGS